MIDKWVCYRNITGNGCGVDDCKICIYGEILYGLCGCCRNGRDCFSYDCFLCSHYDPDKYDYFFDGCKYNPKQHPAF